MKREPIVELDAVTFGHSLRVLRARHRLTQQQLAERAGIRRQHMSDIERGRVNVSLRMIAAVAGAFDMPLSRLLSEIEAVEKANNRLAERATVMRLSRGLHG